MCNVSDTTFYLNFTYRPIIHKCSLLYWKKCLLSDDVLLTYCRSRLDVVMTICCLCAVIFLHPLRFTPHTLMVTLPKTDSNRHPSVMPPYHVCPPIYLWICESLHHSLATLLQLINVLLFVKMQLDTNTITQSVIDYCNISKFCMNKIRKLAMKFSYLILRKTVKIVATRGQILRPKIHQIRFWLGLRPDPAGELTALPQTS